MFEGNPTSLHREVPAFLRPHWDSQVTSRPEIGKVRENCLSTFSPLRFAFKSSLDLSHVLSVEDVFDLHNLYLHVEKIREDLESLGELEKWEEIRSDLLQRTERIKLSSRFQPLTTIALVKDLKHGIKAVVGSNLSDTGESESCSFSGEMEQTLGGKSSFSLSGQSVNDTWHKGKLTQFQYLDLVRRICFLFEGILRSKDEKDLVGFGLEEILGVKFGKKKDWRKEPHEKYPVRFFFVLSPNFYLFSLIFFLHF